MSDEALERPQRRERDEPEELKSPIPRRLRCFGCAARLGHVVLLPEHRLPGRRRRQAHAHRRRRHSTVDGAAVCRATASLVTRRPAGASGVFPPLVGSRWVLENDARLVQILLHGINGPIEVLGVAYNGVMPAFWRSATPSLRRLSPTSAASWGNDALPVAPAEIAAGRERDQGAPRPGAVGKNSPPHSARAESRGREREASPDIVGSTGPVHDRRHVLRRLCSIAGAAPRKSPWGG